MLLSATQEAIREAARRFAVAELAPGAAERDRSGEVPHEALAKLGALGFMGLCVAPEWGGAGADFVSYVVALEEVAAGCGATSTIMSVNNSPVCAAIAGYGTEAQKRRFLVPLAKGEAIGAFLLTEPQAGSDAANLKTRARLVGNRYVLDGVKQFITSGKTAKVAMIFAVTEPEAGKRGISCFLSSTDAPGYRVASIEKKLGQRASDTCQIVLDGLEVPPENLLGRPGEGYRIALANLESGRIGIAAQAIGMARAAFHAARDYAKEREAFGKPIVEHQAITFRLAEMATEIAVARQLALQAAALKDAGLPCLMEASQAKLIATEMAERVCSAAIQIHGGYGYLRDFPVERLWRDVRVCQIYEGTSDIQKLVIARELAGG
ncbi:MAG: acyl-CoA dehydrogenase [Alphaproteobacteria bacterium]|nr:acyl-CoA dehydrogenase [Alphaproteobacteria bacterium]